MTSTPKPQKKKIKYAKALAMLGVAATVAYTTPMLTQLGQAHASGGGNGGGFFSGGFFGMGGGGSGGGGGPRGFGSGGGGFVITDQITAKECGDCHMVYGPDALPQGAWRKVMGDLPNHFGETHRWTSRPVNTSKITCCLAHRRVMAPCASPNNPGSPANTGARFRVRLCNAPSRWPTATLVTAAIIKAACWDANSRHQGLKIEKRGTDLSAAFFISGAGDQRTKMSL